MTMATRVTKNPLARFSTLPFFVQLFLNDKTENMGKLEIPREELDAPGENEEEHPEEDGHPDDLHHNPPDDLPEGIVRIPEDPEGHGLVVLRQERDRLEDQAARLEVDAIAIRERLEAVRIQYEENLRRYLVERMPVESGPGDPK